MLKWKIQKVFPLKSLTVRVQDSHSEHIFTMKYPYCVNNERDLTQLFTILCATLVTDSLASSFILKVTYLPKTQQNQVISVLFEGFKLTDMDSH